MKKLLKVFYEYWIKPWGPYEKDNTDNTTDLDGLSSGCYYE